MPKGKHQYMYPLSDAELRAFRSYFHQQYGASCFYTTDQFIQSAFLEFSDTDADDGTPNTATHYTLDLVAMAEDFHAALRQQRAFTKQIVGETVPCLSCKQTGVNWSTGYICSICGGTARRPKRKRRD